MADPRRAGGAGTSRQPRSRAGGKATREPSAEELLRKAIAARSAAARARWARRGLAKSGELDATTEAMLLRQLYLAHYETARFERARVTALRALELGVLVDVIHQDIARAALAEGDLEAAVAHLRIAGRRGPPSRRPFHQWTLGSILFLAQRYDESIAALTHAVRWGTRDKPLYRAHLALVRIAAGDRVEAVRPLVEELAVSPCGRGYGCFVLGHLSYATGAWDAARRFLLAFVARAESGRPALARALEGELRMARDTLAKMAAN